MTTTRLGSASGPANEPNSIAESVTHPVSPTHGGEVRTSASARSPVRFMDGIPQRVERSSRPCDSFNLIRGSSTGEVIAMLPRLSSSYQASPFQTDETVLLNNNHKVINSHLVVSSDGSEMLPSRLGSTAGLQTSAGTAAVVDHRRNKFDECDQKFTVPIILDTTGSEIDAELLEAPQISTEDGGRVVSGEVCWSELVGVGSMFNKGAQRHLSTDEALTEMDGRLDSSSGQYRKGSSGPCSWKPADIPVCLPSERDEELCSTNTVSLTMGSTLDSEEEPGSESAITPGTAAHKITTKSSVVVNPGGKLRVIKSLVDTIPSRGPPYKELRDARAVEYQELTRCLANLQNILMVFNSTYILRNPYEKPILSHDRSSFRNDRVLQKLCSQTRPSHVLAFEHRSCLSMSQLPQASVRSLRGARAAIPRSLLGIWCNFGLSRLCNDLDPGGLMDIVGTGLALLGRYTLGAFLSVWLGISSDSSNKGYIRALEQTLAFTASIFLNHPTKFGMGQQQINHSIYTSGPHGELSWTRTAGTTTLGKRKGQSENDNDEGGKIPKPETSRKRSKEEPKVSWACPYAKRDIWKYQECLHANLSKISYVKQHLYRSHCVPAHCPRCGEEFLDEDSARTLLNNHLRAGTCQLRYFSFEGRMTEEQKHKVMSAKGRNISDTERWFKIWNILFPGVERPQSPYAQPAAIEVLQAFGASLRGDIGRQIVERVVGSHRALEDHIQIVERTVLAFTQRLQDNHPYVSFGVESTSANWDASAETTSTAVSSPTSKPTSAMTHSDDHIWNAPSSLSSSNDSHCFEPELESLSGSLDTIDAGEGEAHSTLQQPEFEEPWQYIQMTEIESQLSVPQAFSSDFPTDYEPTTSEAISPYGVFFTSADDAEVHPKAIESMLPNAAPLLPEHHNCRRYSGTMQTHCQTLTPGDLSQSAAIFHGIGDSGHEGPSPCWKFDAPEFSQGCECLPSTFVRGVVPNLNNIRDYYAGFISQE